MHWRRLNVSGIHQLIVCEVTANVDTDVAPSKMFFWDASALEGLKCAFQEETLLRVHRNSLFGAEVEKRCIEFSDIVLEKVSTLLIEASGFGGVRVVECIIRETVFGNLRPPTPTTSTKLP